MTKTATRKKGDPILTPGNLQRARRGRFNPLRALTPENLSSALDAFEAGDLRQAALLWQAIAKRDDTIPAVKAKRELSTAQRGWTVLTLEDSPEADRHKAELEYFWNHVTAENAYDRNIRGGFSKLVEQMMESVAFQYAAHHIVWQPRLATETIEIAAAEGAEPARTKQTAPRLTAKFEYVPLQFFENKTGRLKFIEDGVSLEGRDLEDGQWMVTCGQGLMFSVSIGYVLKRLAYTDLVAFSEMFGMPGVLGRTSASADSAAGQAMTRAVETFGNEWRGVIHGDDGSGKIEIIKTEGGSANLPMPIIIDRVDRKIATLFRGSDLSTMSSGHGDVTGASVQGEETDIFDRADARTISETLNEIDRLVLRHQVGDVEPLAYVQLVMPENKDLKFILEAIDKLSSLGMEFGEDSTREFFGLTAPRDGENILRKAAPAPSPFGFGGAPAPAANARSMSQPDALIAKARTLLSTAAARDLRPLHRALVEVFDGPEESLPKRLRSFRQIFPRLVREVFANEALAQAFEKTAAPALFAGLTQE